MRFTRSSEMLRHITWQLTTGLSGQRILSLNKSNTFIGFFFNRLTPNDPYVGRTAPLTSKRSILYIYSTNIGTEYFKHAL